MTNAELIKALRCCIVDFNSTQSRRCNECPYRIYADGKKACENKAKRDAADALEAAEKRIAELESQMPKQGKWISDLPNGLFENVNPWKCNVCGKHQHFREDYCPNCGSRMKTVTDCHALNEKRGEQE